MSEFSGEDIEVKKSLLPLGIVIAVALAIFSYILMSFIQNLDASVEKASIIVAQNMLLRGADLQSEDVKNIRITSHSYTEPKTWTSGISKFTWKPPKDKVWIITQILMICDNSVIDMSKPIFSQKFDGDITRKAETESLNILNSIASNVEQVKNKEGSFIDRVHYYYDIPLFLYGKYGDKIEIGSISNIPINANKCDITIIGIEKNYNSTEDAHSLLKVLTK